MAAVWRTKFGVGREKSAPVTPYWEKEAATGRIGSQHDLARFCAGSVTSSALLREVAASKSAILRFCNLDSPRKVPHRLFLQLGAGASNLS